MAMLIVENGEIYQVVLCVEVPGIEPNLVARF
jgi:hypothetical protein